MIKICNFNIKQFLKEINSKKIIFFCAGQKFFDLCKKYQLSSRILYVVDNHKSGTSIQLGENNIPVLSLDDVGYEVQDCVLLISTIKYVDELIPQLDESEIFDSQVFYFPELFEDKEDQWEFENNKISIIPPIIHYCWFGNGKIPIEFQKNIDTWKLCCPDYEIRCWNETNYDITKNKYMKQAYEMKKWGFVPDYARLDIINSYGGIYLDTDVELLRSLSDLQQYKMFCGFENEKYVNLGLGFGSVKDNPIIQEMMEIYMKTDFIDSDGILNTTPSPIYQTQVMEKFGIIRNGRTQQVQDAVVLAPEYLSPINGFGFGKPTKNSFSIHHYAATWFDSGQQRAKDKMINNYKYVMKRISNI